MTKSELIERLADQARHIPAKELELAIKELLEQMAQTLQKGERIEIRGFGSFSLHYRAPRVGRNPKTGETVKLDGKYVPCLLYTSPSPRDRTRSRMPSSA